MLATFVAFSLADARGFSGGGTDLTIFSLGWSSMNGL
jgi:hypothetical protein